MDLHGKKFTLHYLVHPTEPAAAMNHEEPPLDHESIRRAIVSLLYPLVGIRGQYRGKIFEIIEVLSDGPCVALLDTTSAPGIRANQFGDAFARQNRILTIPVFSTPEPRIHPALAALLPEDRIDRLLDLKSLEKS